MFSNSLLLFCSNNGAKTIDDDLIEGLHKAGCITDQNFNDDRRFVKVMI